MATTNKSRILSNERSNNLAGWIGGDILANWGNYGEKCVDLLVGLLALRCDGCFSFCLLPERWRVLVSVTQYFLDNFFYVFSPKSITVRKLDIDPARGGESAPGLAARLSCEPGSLTPLVTTFKVTRTSGDRKVFSPHCWDFFVRL